MRFEVNRGQAHSGVDFVAAGANYGVSLSSGRAALHLKRGLSQDRVNNPASTELSIQLLGANLNPTSEAEDKLPGYSNYLFGPDPTRWITGVEQYAKVRYANIYPGIDVVYYGNQQRLEHDFVVHAGTDPSQIRIALSGMQATRLNNHGDLVLQLAGGEVQLQKPYAYQQFGDRKVHVAARYSLRNGRANFRLGNYDRTRTLLIDPVLVYSTFLGGTFTPDDTVQTATAATVDSAGNLYVGGSTDSVAFPVTSGTIEQSNNSTPRSVTGFVSKINPAGTALLYSTYIDGFVNGPCGIVVDATGNLYVAGNANPGLPIPAGSHPFQATSKGFNPGILKLNSTATAALYGTYLGGSGTDSCGGLAVDTAGNAYIAGRTTSNDFPTMNPLQSSLGSSGENAFVTKLNPTGSALVYSTYLGQSSHSFAAGVAIDASNDAYVVGLADNGFPTTMGAFQQTWSGPNPCINCSNAFFAKLNPGGSALLYATYLGGSGNSGSVQDRASAVAVDGSGNAITAGVTNSPDFPAVNPVQTCNTTAVQNGAFVSEFNAAGALIFSTCLGNDASSNSPALALDSANNVYIAGRSDSSLPLVNPIDGSNPAQSASLFISEISSANHTLLFSTFLANNAAANVFETDAISAISVDPTGNIYAVGSSLVTEDPTRNPSSSGDFFPIFNALQPEFGPIPICNHTNAAECRYGNAVIMKISPMAGAAAAVAPSHLTFTTVQLVGGTSDAQVVNVYNYGTSPLTISTVTVSGDFAVQNGCASVGPSGASCAIQVTFTPTATGTRNGTVTITDGSPGSPHTIALTGTGGAAVAVVSPSSLSFGTQAVGTSSESQTVTVSNSGAIPLTISRVQISGPFSETNTCSAPIFSGGAQCTISVTFSPTDQTAATGALQITDNASDSPQTVALSGIGGSNLGLGVVSGNANSATVNAGGTAVYQLSIGGVGLTGTASLSCTGFPVGASCSVPATITVSPSTPTPFTVTVTTTPRFTAELRRRNPQRYSWLLAFGIMGWISMAGSRARRGSKRFPLVLLVLMVSAALSSSCGGGNSNRASGGTPAGAYMLTVAAQSGSTSQSTTLTLNVN